MESRKVIITIGRQYGSGGSEIGRKLAHELGVDFYDKNILRMNSVESGIKESYYHLADEKAGDNPLYRIMSSLSYPAEKPSIGPGMLSADNLFRFQSEVIRKLAEKQSCVIVGRCADYILEGRDDIELVRVYLYADMESRVKRVTELGLYGQADVRKNMKRIDRERREYYRYYTGREWASPENYDLMLNTASNGISGCARLVEEYLKIKGYRI